MTGLERRQGIRIDAEKVARGLGWFSIVPGLYETAAPGHLGRTLGMEGREGVLRFYGLREITAGVGILSQPGPSAGWLWARVGGDALDLATLGAALKPDNPKRGSVWVALGSVVGVTLLDIWCGLRLGSGDEKG